MDSCRIGGGRIVAPRLWTERCEWWFFSWFRCRRLFSDFPFVPGAVCLLLLPRLLTLKALSRTNETKTTYAKRMQAAAGWGQAGPRCAVHGTRMSSCAACSHELSPSLLLAAPGPGELWTTGQRFERLGRPLAPRLSFDHRVIFPFFIFPFFFLDDGGDARRAAHGERREASGERRNHHRSSSARVCSPSGCSCLSVSIDSVSRRRNTTVMFFFFFREETKKKKSPADRLGLGRLLHVSLRRKSSREIQMGNTRHQR